jgi:hypothetical protein
MKKLVILLSLLQISVLPLAAAEGYRVGSVADLAAPPAVAVPLLLEIPENELASAATALVAMTPEQRKQTTVVVRYAVDTSKDALLDIEQHTKSIGEWARVNGPFDALGVAPDTTDGALAAYAVKRLAVTAQGLNVASRIVLPRDTDLAKLFDNGAQPYFDALLVDGPKVAETLLWLAERDPSKKIYAVVAIEAPNALFDLAKALAAGAERAYGSAAAEGGRLYTEAFAQFNKAFTGDWAFDSTAKTSVLDAKGADTTMPVLTFVRGEDLRTIVIPRGDAAAPSIVAMSNDQYAKPRRIDAAGEKAITDTGAKGGRVLVGTTPAKAPFLVVLDYAERPKVTKETVNVATQRGITVEEIIRNHQAYDAFQESVQPKYIAKNTTKLRFDIGGGAEAVEAAIVGDYFSDPNGRADWVWSDFYINGVRWKYGRIPELPLIQPEKVAQLPLDIHLTNEYVYRLIRETDLLGYKVYEVRFEPPANAPTELPLYRGTVFIDARTWARVRISMVQLNLTGEVLSNEERVDFIPFSAETKRPLTLAEAASVDPRRLIWLPQVVGAQQVISAAGRATVIQRETTFDNFRVDPVDFELKLAEVSKTDARMVRETEKGMRYLERRGDGERVVKEGYDTARLFAVGGIHHDSGLEYPVVPLGGIDYFNFNLRNTGIQTNVFFAGVVLAANATHPNVKNTRTNVGADLFAIAIPTESTIFRNGEEQPGESIKSRPMGFFLRAGRPFATFGKIDLSMGVSHLSYSEADDTAPGFEAPSSTFVLSPGIELRYARRGVTMSASYDYNRRTSWEPWGILSEYDPEQKSYAHFGASIGKSFFLPKFQRIGVDVNYLDGQRLDRFSKYELGFFGARRVHGIESGSVRAEKMILAHLSYGFVFSDQFRIEAIYDHAFVDDAIAGYRREPFQGVGLAGQTVGPFGTLLRLDIGKSIGRNAQDGFVANVVFLKLF